MVIKTWVHVHTPIHNTAYGVRYRWRSPPKHSSMSVWQLSPSQPGVQEHVKPWAVSDDSAQAPPFWQGFGEQGLRLHTFSPVLLMMCIWSMFPLAADASEEKVSTLNSWQRSCVSTERISSTVIWMSSEAAVIGWGEKRRSGKEWFSMQWSLFVWNWDFALPQASMRVFLRTVHWM